MRRTASTSRQRLLAAATAAVVALAARAHGADGADALELRAALAGSALSAPAVEAAPVPALRGPVDADTYVVGPGDALSITLWGRTVITRQATVKPEGDLIIQGISPIHAAGRTLAALKTEVAERLSRVYHDMDVSVSLLSLRSMEVNVLGAVETPGAYTATALDLASELIRKAGGFSAGASDRNIVITRRDGSAGRADLVRYRNTGAVAANPPVLDGDVIFVPFATRFVYAYGGIARPGRYELTEGETVGSLVELAGGFVRGAVTESVELRTFRDAVLTDSRPVDLTDPAGPATALGDGDQVYVMERSNWRVVRTVFVEGEFVHPGVYGINEGVDRLSDVVRRAGGPTPAASLLNARLIRGESSRRPDPEFERLAQMLPSDMSETEYAYFKAKSSQLPGAVVVDFERLLSGAAAEDPLLRDGDRIVVPRMTATVTVSGRVRRPGEVTFVPGKTARYYVGEAGGFASLAKSTGVRVVRRATGQQLSSREAGALQSGDEVWVPERPESDWWETARDLASFAASLATAYLLIDQATGN